MLHARTLVVPGIENDTKDRVKELQESLGFDEFFEIDMSKGMSVDPIVDRSSGVSNKVEVQEGDIVRLEMEHGEELYLSLDSFEEIYAEQSQRRGSLSNEDELFISPQLPSSASSRGFISNVLKRIDVFNLREKLSARTVTKSGEQAIRVLAKKIEENIINDGGLFSAELIREQILVSRRDGNWKDESFTPVFTKKIDASKPVLVFIHGTFSSTAGGFSDLLAGESDDFWNSIKEKFGDQIYGFDHKTLSQSPIRNALDLCKTLPKGAKVHLITHSRGGLVGEFLARGQVSATGAIFSKEEIGLFEGKDRDGKIIKDAFAWLLQHDQEHGNYEEHLSDLQSLEKELKKKSIMIERFVRVGCPARGTTAASKRLDITLNVLLFTIGQIPVLRLNPMYKALKAFLLAAIKDRTNPESLPGLEAQMPGSPQIKLLNNRKVNTDAHLAVIASNYEPKDGHRFYDWLVDMFYGGANDLVVNFASMDGGGYRRSAVAVMETSRSVMHTQYFAQPSVRDGIKELVLTDNLTPPGFEFRKRSTEEIKRSNRGSHLGLDAPCVIILPGITGSHLKVGDDRVWVDLSDLACGAFKDLDFDNGKEVTPDGLYGGAYDKLGEYLSATHKVVDFSYDWRKSIKDAGKRLAETIRKLLDEREGPIRIVAHSMGGLVTRAAMAEDPRAWAEFVERDGARFIMLGTPNKGSHSIVRLMVGQNRLINMLSFADPTMKEREYVEILRRFPGVLELLPLSHDERAYGKDIWKEFSGVLGDKWKLPVLGMLEQARKTWETIERVPLDPKITFYVAGQDKKTPVDWEVKGWLKKRIRFLSSSQGDGQVLWADGIPPGIKHWFSRAKHADLAKDKKTIPAIFELLDKGNTSRLPTRVWSRRGSEDLAYMPPGHVSYLPEHDDILTTAWGGGEDDEGESMIDSPIIKLSVAHGNLVFADHPILVGQFINETIDGAQDAIDRRVNGRLRERHRLGLYPGKLNTSDLIRSSGDLGNFPGALVVGLGAIGELSPGELMTTIQAAFLRYCLESHEAQSGEKRSGLKLCALIPAAGAGGVSMSDSLEAVVKAAMSANEILLHSPNNKALPLTEISFIELYEDVAVEAQHLLLKLGRSPSFRGGIAVEDCLVKGDAGHYRVSMTSDRSQWQRLRISVDEGLMSFLPLSDRAGLPMITTAEERLAVEPFLEEVTCDFRFHEDTGRVLHELLIPKALKSKSQDNRPLVLILDKEAAAYPWEVLAYNSGEKNEALALQSSMIRQLTATTVDRPNLCRNKRALVLTDPLSNFPELRGAQIEGVAVHGLLNDEFQTTLRERPDAKTVIRELMSQEYQIIHLAGHGAFDYVPKELIGTPEEPDPVSGMVIGDGLFLTPSLIERIPATPELVFINCCHLGNTEEDKKRFPSSPHILAANLATQLIQQGVSAVIAAGWAVDDAAALTFSKCFYEGMSSGWAFGEAVSRARKVTYDNHPNCNTWAAYQCYGDPSYVFSAGYSAGEKQLNDRPVLLAEAIVHVINIAQNAKTLRDHCPDCVIKDLEIYLSQLPEEWLLDGKFSINLGNTWLELDELERALKAFAQARLSNESEVTFKVIECEAKCRARYAAKQAEAVVKLKEGKAEEIARLRAMIDESAADLNFLEKKFGKTARRSAALGSVKKNEALLEATCGSKRSCTRALREMEQNYRAAYEQTVKENGFEPYPLNNLLLATFLANPQRKEHPEEVRALVAKSRALAIKSSGDSGDLFWKQIAKPNQLALHALLEGEFDAEINELAKEYQKVQEIAGSPYQMSLVSSDLSLIRKVMEDKECAGFVGQIARLQRMIRM